MYITGIVVPPISVYNTTINGTANFTCTAIGSGIEWEVNGQPVDANLRNRGFNDQAVPLTLLNATQNLLTRTLSAFGSADNNGSNITCVTFFISPLSIMQSEPAVLFLLELGMYAPHKSSSVCVRVHACNYTQYRASQ